MSKDGKRRARRAQAEYIGMALLVLAIVILALVSRVGQQQSSTKQTETLADELTESYVNVNIQTVLYSTAMGIPSSEIIGDYMCYNDSTPDYGTGPISLESELRRRLDTYYGKDRWMLMVNSSLSRVQVPQIAVVIDRSGSMINPRPDGSRSNFEIVQAALQSVSPTSTLWSMGDYRFSSGSPPGNNCDLSISSADPGLSPGGGTREESWANVAAYVAANGPPQASPPYFIGWPPNTPKLVFVSSDELSCSIGPTDQYVDAAIAVAQANGVRFYFLEPPFLNPDGGPSNEAYLRAQMARFSTSTGGKTINVTTISDVAVEIANAAATESRTLSAFTLTSSDFVESVAVPTGSDVISYHFPISAPCSTGVDVEGYLFVFRTADNCVADGTCP